MSMHAFAKTGGFPAKLKVPPLESSSEKYASMTFGTATPERKAAAEPRTPPNLKMRRSHRSATQTDKIPTLADISSVSRCLFPKESNHEDDDDDNDSMSIDGIFSGALLATPPRGGSSISEHKMGPPLPRRPSFLQVDTCRQKTIPHHVTPSTASASSSSSSSIFGDQQHAAACGASSSSCSTGFIGGTANSAFAANSHDNIWKKGTV